MKLEPNIVYKVNTSLDLKLYPIDIEGTGSVMLESGNARDNITPKKQVYSSNQVVFKMKYQYFSYVVMSGSPVLTCPDELMNV